MNAEEIQRLCQVGQDQLMRMEYLAAEQTLAGAEKNAWENKDFDSLARLYMPLQEARRQRRQRCGEGTVCLDLLAKSPQDSPSGPNLIVRFPHGQLLVAGWGSIQPAIEARHAQAQSQRYVDVFLAAVYPADAGRVIVIVPSEDVALPPPQPMTLDTLIRRSPAHSIVTSASELPAGEKIGSPETYATVMALWERLHLPFLAAADATADPIRRIEAYRKVIRVDYACELAHQRISDLAHQLCKRNS